MGRYLVDAEQKASDAVVIAVNEPRTLRFGEKTLIDPENPSVTPIINGDRTLVPVRFVAETLGFNVEWDESTGTVTLIKDTTVVKLVINQNVMNVNGTDVMLDTAAITHQNRTVIPLRAVSDAFGKKVKWYNNGLITIGDEENIFDQVGDKDKIDYLFDILSL